MRLQFVGRRLFFVFCLAVFLLETFAATAAESQSPTADETPSSANEQALTMEVMAASGGVGTPSSISYSTTNSTNGLYTVTWGTALYADHYLLEENFNNQGFVLVGQFIARTYTPTPAKSNGTYAYRVQACDLNDECGGFRTAIGSITVSIPAPTLSVTASPTTIAYNQGATLSWSSSNAQSCTYGGSPVGLTGNMNVGPLQTTQSFSITCTGSGGSVTQSITINVVPLPLINSFTASPHTIAVGSSSTLAWSSTHATSCTINSNSVAVSGSSVFTNIASTTNYTLLCSNISGNVSRVLTVTAVPPPTTSLSASPSAIATNGSTTLTWNSTNTTSCTLNGNGVVVNGSQTFNNITSTSTYTLSCSGIGGSNSTATTVTVVPAPTLTLTASPSTIASGESSTLTWTSTNAGSCTLDGGSVVTNGNATKANITATKNYTLACSGTGGSANKSITVTVAPIPAVTFSVDAALIEKGTATTLRWSSSNATSCSLNGQSVGTSGPQSTGTLSAAQNYSLTCTGIGGTSQPRTASVSVAQSWANVSACDPTTGKQTQVCVHGSLCSLNSTRQVASCGASNIGCSN